MVSSHPSPRYGLINDPHEAKRVRTTVSCRDADEIPKVANAGELAVLNGVPVQVMHNGLLIYEGCYGGVWMTEVIRGLRGHHEPQQEAVFDAILRRLTSEDPRLPTMVEFGSFWAYYTMWFAAALPKAKIVAMEPDPSSLEVGRRNVELNGLTNQVHFVPGMVGDHPGQLATFIGENSEEEHAVLQYDLASTLDVAGLERVDLVLADVQGAETVLLRRALPLLTAARVRFLVVSTHHRSISGDVLTHQRALQLLTNAGAHVIAEHSVPESFSGDGLIAVSFDRRDADFTVRVSFARSKDCIFDEVEYELDAETSRLASAQAAEHERDVLLKSASWRVTLPFRQVAALVKRGRAPHR